MPLDSTIAVLPERAPHMDSSLELSSSVGSVSSLLPRCRTFKVVVIGDSGVGKTCLTHRLCAGEFPARAEATIGVDFRERAVDVDGERIKLQLWDTAGQERFRKSMVQHYYRNVNAVLFVYDVTCPASFVGLSAWMEECRQNALGQEIPRFLVGTKCDLRDPARAEQQVCQQEAISFAKAHRMTFFETSAKNPPDRRVSGRGGRRRPSAKEASYQQNKVEDIGVAVAAKLKRQKKTRAAANATMYGDSISISARKGTEKDVWYCC